MCRVRVPARSRALLLAQILIVTAGLMGGPALAQPVDPPPSCPGGTTSLSKELWGIAFGGAKGRNLVSVEFTSSLNDTPDDGTNNGFHRLCNLMGLGATGDPATMPDIDGDGRPDNALLRQFNGKDGIVVDYFCHQTLAGNPWNPGQGVEVDLFLSKMAGDSITIPLGADFCTQGYAAYPYGSGGPLNSALGTQLTVIPLDGVSMTRVDLCVGLNLPDGSEVKTIDAERGFVEITICSFDAQPVPPFLRPGESAFLTVPYDSENPPGGPVNCASPPCPVPGPSVPPFTFPCLPLSGTVSTVFCP